VLDGDLIAEEPRRAGAGVGDQRLAGVQLQLEGSSQERSQLGLDLPGFGPGPDEPQQMIICLCRVPYYADRDVEVLVRALYRAAGAA